VDSRCVARSRVSFCALIAATIFLAGCADTSRSPPSTETVTPSAPSSIFQSAEAYSGRTPGESPGLGISALGEAPIKPIEDEHRFFLTGTAMKVEGTVAWTDSAPTPTDVEIVLILAFNGTDDWWLSSSFPSAKGASPLGFSFDLTRISPSPSYSDTHVTGLKLGIESHDANGKAIARTFEVQSTVTETGTENLSQMLVSPNYKKETYEWDGQEYVQVCPNQSVPCQAVLAGAHDTGRDIPTGVSFVYAELNWTPVAPGYETAQLRLDHIIPEQHALDRTVDVTYGQGSIRAFWRVENLTSGKLQEVQGFTGDMQTPAGNLVANYPQAFHVRVVTFTKMR